MKNKKKTKKTENLSLSLAKKKASKNLKTLALNISLLEGKKVQCSIAQITEILAAISDISFGQGIEASEAIVFSFYINGMRRAIEGSKK